MYYVQFICLGYIMNVFCICIFYRLFNLFFSVDVDQLDLSDFEFIQYINVDIYRFIKFFNGKIFNLGDKFE